jgi:hypothetical protein
MRSRLTFSNVTAAIALFVALGGVSYAAATLPANSVGTKQLRDDAVRRADLAPGSVGTRQLGRRSVTARKLATRSVTKRSLSRWIRGELRRRGATGPRGPAGPTGPAGPRGPAAVAIRLEAEAGATPAPRRLFDVGGLALDASCDVAGGTTTLNLSPTAAQAGTIYETVTVESGADPAVGGTTDFTGNMQIEIPAGSGGLLGGPEATDEFTRIGANAVYVTATTTVHLQLFLLVVDDAGTDSGRCSVHGTAIPAA